jgi:tRNA pseudouridine55 synthase
MPEPASGLVVVDKQAGMTSHDVVARVRRLAGTRKVGHAGTLDPMATGVLVLGLNRATRLLGHLTLTDKRYAATIRLGVSTTTDDAEGEVIATAPTGALTDEAVRQALEAYVGEIDQVPSAVSAIKIAGKRAYARVRDGEVVELPARRVTVHSLGVVSTSLGDAAEVDIEVHCSSGTYIRAIARDLGEALGVGGHLTALRRTRVGRFDLAAASTMAQLQAAKDTGDGVPLVPLADAARASFAPRELSAAEATAVGHGQRIPSVQPLRAEPVAAFAPDGALVAMLDERGTLAKAHVVFAPSGS